MHGKDLVLQDVIHIKTVYSYLYNDHSDSKKNKSDWKFRKISACLQNKTLKCKRPHIASVKSSRPL